MSSTRDDVLTRACARTHRAIYPSAARCSEKLGVHRSTPSNWALGRPGNPTKTDSLYLLLAENPWEHVAHQNMIVKLRTVEKLTRDELIDRCWELRELETHIEGVDNLMARQPGHTMGERAEQKRKDAAVELELAAIYLEFESRGITESHVREWATARESGRGLNGGALPGGGS